MMLIEDGGECVLKPAMPRLQGEQRNGHQLVNAAVATRFISRSHALRARNASTIRRRLMVVRDDKDALHHKNANRMTESKPTFTNFTLDIDGDGMRSSPECAGRTMKSSMSK